MKISAVISEFNPFHSGHKYLIDKIRENGATHIVAVMSGNYVQRGECAVFSKWDRAKCALENGVDLVVENPLIYATASAQRFAFGAVGVIKGLGVVDELCFGSESGEIEKLIKVSGLIEKDDYSDLLQRYLKDGNSFPKARELAISEKYGKDIGDIISKPNNILACEYISECLKADMDIGFFTTKRIGVQHDSLLENQGYYSASNLRQMLKDNLKSNDKLFEDIRNGCKVYDFTLLETAILVKLKSLTLDKFLNLPDVSEGMENRLFSAAQNSSSLEEFYNSVKTKRYTHSRIRRICLCVLLGIEKDDVSRPVPYVRVIGFNDKGKEILKISKKEASLPIVMKYSDLKDLDDNAKQIFNKESFATDVFSLATLEKESSGREKTENIIKISEN